MRKIRLIVLVWLNILFMGIGSFSFGETVSPWWNSNWRYRMPIEVEANKYPQIDSPVVGKINFTNVFKELGTSSKLDINSIRLIEYSLNGVILGEIPSQFDKSSKYSSSNEEGEVFWIMRGKMQKGDKRKHYLYFDILDNRPKSSPNYSSPLQVNVFKEKVTVKNEFYRAEFQKGMIKDFRYLKGSGENVVDAENNRWILGIQTIPRNRGWSFPLKDLKGEYYLAKKGPLRVTFRIKGTIDHPVFPKVRESFTVYAYNPRVEFTQYLFVKEVPSELEICQFMFNISKHSWVAWAPTSTGYKKVEINGFGDSWLSKENSNTVEMCWAISSSKNRFDSFAYFLDREKLSGMTPYKFRHYDLGGDNKIQWHPSTGYIGWCRLEGGITPHEYVGYEKGDKDFALKELLMMRNKPTVTLGKVEKFVSTKEIDKKIKPVLGYKANPRLWDVKLREKVALGEILKGKAYVNNDYNLPVKGFLEVNMKDKNLLRTSVELDPLEKKGCAFQLKAPSSLGGYSIYVKLFDEKGDIIKERERYFSVVTPVTVKVKPLKSFFSQNPIEAKISLTNNLERKIDNLKVVSKLLYLNRVVRTETKQITLTKDYAIRIIMDTKDLPTGEYTLRTEAFYDDKLLGEGFFNIGYLRKKYREVRIDKGKILIDGEPSLSIGTNPYLTGDLERDLRKMREIGFNSLRSIIHWKWVETNKNQFNFSETEPLNWIPILNFDCLCQGEKMLFPDWFIKEYPDCYCYGPKGEKLPTVMNGFPMEHEGFAKYSQRFTKEFIKYAKENLECFAYAVGGELCNRHINHHPSAKRAYRDWLKERYNTVEHVNNFWKADYKNFEEINPPMKKPKEESIIWCDYVEFRLDSLKDFIRAHYQIAKESDPSKPVSTLLFTRGWGRKSATWGSSFSLFKDYQDYLGLDVYPGLRYVVSRVTLIDPP